VCFLWGLVSLLAWGLQRVLFKDGMVAAPSSCLPTLDSMYLQCLSQAGFVQHCQEKEEWFQPCESTSYNMTVLANFPFKDMLAGFTQCVQSSAVENNSSHSSSRESLKFHFIKTRT
jgi:hypothetical protein